MEEEGEEEERGGDGRMLGNGDRHEVRGDGRMEDRAG